MQQHGLLILDSKIAGDWKYIMSEVTDKHGRITYNLPPEHSVGYGLYPVRMVVRGDHSCLHMTLACLPPKTETVRLVSRRPYFQIYSILSLHCFDNADFKNNGILMPKLF